MCSDEVVQLFYLSGSLSVGLNLLGGLAGNERSGQRHALAETYRADLNSQIGQGCRGMIGVVSNWRDGIVKLTKSSSIDPQDTGLQPVANPPCWASKTAASLNLTVSIIPLPAEVAR